MKKIIVFAAAIALSASAFAQSPLKGLVLGGGLSINPTGFKATVDGVDVSNFEPKSMTGFNIFATYEYSFTDADALSAGLRFQWTSAKNTSSIYGVEKVSNVYWTYLDLPIKYIHHFGGFYVNAGPTLQLWTGCSEKKTVTYQGESEPETVNYFKQDGAKDVYNRFNVCIGAEVGYDWSHIRLFAGYDFSLIPGFKNDYAKSDGVNFNKSNIRVGVAYLF